MTPEFVSVGALVLVLVVLGCSLVPGRDPLREANAVLRRRRR